MAKAQNKTQPTKVTAEEFLATVEPEQRRRDGLWFYWNVSLN
ncbi:MAG: hypothetical protein O2910_01275 [Proteobacteria bacterium]|nr:hypothetical protein [Pseudomonadota bacterium]